LLSGRREQSQPASLTAEAFLSELVPIKTGTPKRRTSDVDPDCKSRYPTVSGHCFPMFWGEKQDALSKKN
jgi:hypothetical protein